MLETIIRAGVALIAAGSLMQSVYAADVVVRPLEYAKALKNPCKGLRFNGGQEHVNPDNPLISLSHDYIRWNTIENSASDGIDKIRRFCDNAWKDLPSRNVKVIPRVYLDWPNQGVHWPADMTTGDYSSAQFKARMVRLIQRLGQLWDRDPRVAFVEMGIIGQWGEQHDPSPDVGMQKLWPRPILPHSSTNSSCGGMQTISAITRPWDYTGTRSLIRRTMNPAGFLPGEIAGNRSHSAEKWRITGECKGGVWE